MKASAARMARIAPRQADHAEAPDRTRRPSQAETPVRITVGGTLHWGANAFDDAVRRATGSPLRAATIRTFQVNVGLRCNLACRHCHVESGPKRTEEMAWDTMQMVLNAARIARARTIDITGGAPEMNPHFRRLVSAARAQGHDVLVRTNLTIALEQGFEDLPEFFAQNRVHLVASLPCYLQTNVDRQRGRHVYVESVEVIRRLNRVGFGVDPNLPLYLVYNPGGPSLPPPQAQLEADYRRELDRQFGLRFTGLYTITNMPIGRFQHDLERNGRGEVYRLKLRDSFNPSTIEPLMCRHQVHVSHDGALHDCDFNYALGMRVNSGELVPAHIRDLQSPRALDAFVQRRIATGEHCFACTAGCGSSCGGALTA